MCMTNFLKATIILNKKERIIMSQVIMWFLFPMGLYFYFFVERKNRPAYEKVFTDYEASVQSNTSLSDAEKIQQYKEMLRKNEYNIIETTPTSVVGEKRIFSMSLFAMSAGLYLVGVVFYLLYWYYIQTPHRVTFHTQRDSNA